MGLVRWTGRAVVVGDDGERGGGGDEGGSWGYRRRVMRVGVDTGGTFTDVVTEDGDVVKVPSQPADPAAAVAAGVGRRCAVDLPGPRHDRGHQRAARTAGARRWRW